MALEFNISPEDIERLVKDSIMRSGFGKAVEDGVKKAIGGGYDNPIDKEVKSYVGEVCAQLIREHFAVSIRAAVQAHIEAKVTQELIDTTTRVAVEKMVSAADRY